MTVTPVKVVRCSTPSLPPSWDRDLDSAQTLTVSR
jgi:hypothetical protein